MIESGKTFEVDYPFVRERVEVIGENGPEKMVSWIPGCGFEMCGPEDSRAVADGLGKMILHVVSTHKPGRYPTRVFYTRKWRDPDGKEFGKPGLRVLVQSAFTRRTQGYMHPFELETG